MFALIKTSCMRDRNRQYLSSWNPRRAATHQNFYCFFFLGNPLDCTCKLSDFQKWVKESAQLDRHSRQEAKCATPPRIANAVISDLPELQCNHDHSDAKTMQDFAELKQNTSLIPLDESLNDVDHILKMSWKPSQDLPFYSCHNLQVMCVSSSGQQDVYSEKLDCDSAKNDQRIAIDLDTSVIPSCDDPESTYLVCVFVQNNSAPADPPIPGCSQVILNPINYHKTLVSSLRASLHSQSKTLTVSFDTHPPPSFFTDKSAIRSCTMNLQVVDTDLIETGDSESVVSNALIPCTSQSYKFTKIFIHGHLKVCVTQELVYDIAITTDKTCTRVMETFSEPLPVQRTPVKERPLLPLILTLVFLCVGIIALVILYLIFKGCLKDRRDVFLNQFQSVSSNPFHEDGQRCSGLSQNIRRTLWFICPLGIFKGRRRRRRPQSDELYLDDDDDNCTEMSQVIS